jgi:hypothetical protein
MVDHNGCTIDTRTRDSSAIDGLERVRSMYGVRVRLEDVTEREEVGHIAVETLSGRGGNSRRLKNGRLYSYS